MKVALDARKIDDFGIGTYIQGLLAALPAVGQPEALVAYLPPGRRRAGGRGGVGRARPSGGRCRRGPTP